MISEYEYKSPFLLKARRGFLLAGDDYHLTPQPPSPKRRGGADGFRKYKTP